MALLATTKEVNSLRSIWTYDTGSGGILAARKLIEEGKASLVHCFIDPQYAPYGDKQPNFIRNRLVGFINYAHSILPEPSYGIVACNTASRFLEDVTKYINLDKGTVVSVIDPILQDLENFGGHHAKMSELYNQSGETLKDLHIVIFGTQSTIKSNFYQEKLRLALPHAKIAGVACPSLATLIDDASDLAILKAVVERHVTEYVNPKGGQEIPEGASVIVVLGCTHFNKVVEDFEKWFACMGIDAHILDQHKLTLGYAKYAISHTKLDQYEKSEVRLVVHATGELSKARRMVENLFPSNEGRTENGIYRLGLADIEVVPAEIPLNGHWNLLKKSNAYGAHNTL